MKPAYHNLEEFHTKNTEKEKITKRGKKVIVQRLYMNFTIR